MLLRPVLAGIAVALIACAAFLAACGGGDNNNTVSGVQAVDTEGCGDVQYAGSGTPDKLIVSDLPLQGDSAERSKQQNDAIVQMLAKRGWQAGGQIQVAFQPCDDSIASTGEWDQTRCKDNATAYANDPDVIGVIGTYNSGCAALMIPILNKAPGGGLAMVSPGNTLVCLTEPGSNCEPGQPDNLYPSGKRNYARVVPNDAVQGAALATWAKDQGISNPYILVAADDPTSTGQADNFEGAAKALGMKIAGRQDWNPDAPNYTDLMNQVKKSGADAVLLAGLLEQNGAQIIKDKVAVLGPNTGAGVVKLFAPDGFAQQSTIDQAGQDSAGLFVSVPGKTPGSLTEAGRSFVQLIKSQAGKHPVELFAPYAGQAAEVMLNAIQQGKDRAGTINSLYGMNIKDGIIGTFRISDTGDPVPAPISINEAAGRFVLVNQLVPEPQLVTAARGKPAS